MYVTLPVTASTPFCTSTSPAITSPDATRFADIAAMAPACLVLHASVAARPVSCVVWQAGGACVNNCWSVRRFAGRSRRRFLGMMMFWPPTTIWPPAYTSPGASRKMRSISPLTVPAPATAELAPGVAAMTGSAPANMAMDRTSERRKVRPRPVKWFNMSAFQCRGGRDMNARGQGHAGLQPVRAPSSSGTARDARVPELNSAVPVYDKRPKSPVSVRSSVIRQQEPQSVVNCSIRRQSMVVTLPCTYQWTTTKDVQRGSTWSIDHHGECCGGFASGNALINGARAPRHQRAPVRAARRPRCGPRLPPHATRPYPLGG